MEVHNDKAQAHRISVLIWFVLYVFGVFMVVGGPVCLDMHAYHQGTLRGAHVLHGFGTGLLYAIDYACCRFAIVHPVAAGALVVGSFVALLKLFAWRRRKANLRYVLEATGVEADREALRFRTTEVELFEALKKRARGQTFVGKTPVQRRLRPGYAWKAVYLSEAERDTHRHVLGKTGSGKTSSILWPQVLQDALDGKGVTVMDAKGSDENARMMKAIAYYARREADMRHVSLAAWNNSKVFSHGYNMLDVAVRQPDGHGGDVLLMAERVFNVLGLSPEPYYNAQARLAFFRLCRLLHGMVGTSGYGLPFNMVDLSIALRGLVSGAPESTAWGKALRHCLKQSKERDAADELSAWIAAKGPKLEEDLAGLVAAVENFQSPVVNAYGPDLSFEVAMQKNLLVYVQLPSNLYPLQAPALGKVMLADIQQQTAHRQTSRRERNQKPFSVNIDEFGTFATMLLVDSLNKARDAHVQYTMCHQSSADTDRVSKDLTQAVWDNTLTKDLLRQDDPALCERYAQSIGTYPYLEHTVQQAPDVAGGLGPTGVTSTKAVEKYILHPNRLKALSAAGHGYVFLTRAKGRGALPVVYAQMPDITAHGDYKLPAVDQSKARGLRLKEKYIEPARAARPVEVVQPVEAPPPTAAPVEAPRPSPAARAVPGVVKRAVQPDELRARRPEHPRQQRPFRQDDTVAMPPPPPDDVVDEPAPSPKAKPEPANGKPEAGAAHELPTVAMQRLKKKVSNG